MNLDRSSARTSGFGPFVLCLLLAASASCSGSDTTAPSLEPLIAAEKGGNGGGPQSKSSDPTVEDSDPREAPQDSTLDVRVFGTGFEPGAEVRFLLDGKATGNIVTNSTSFVSDTEVVANISIGLEADTVFYDIEVANDPRRRGVGTELFKVNEKETAVFRDATTDFITSDGLGIYTNEIDDVSIGITDAGQIFFETNTTTPDERKMIVRVEDASGAVLWDGPADPRMQTRMVSEPGGVDVYSLEVGESVRVPVRIQWHEDTRTYRLRFGRECDENIAVPDEMGQVTRTGANPGVWVVESGPYGRLCIGDNQGTRRPNDNTSEVIRDVTAPFAVTINDELGG